MVTRAGCSAKAVLTARAWTGGDGYQGGTAEDLAVDTSTAVPHQQSHAQWPEASPSVPAYALEKKQSQAVRTVLGTARAWGGTRLHGSSCVVVVAAGSLRLATQS